MPDVNSPSTAPISGGNRSGAYMTPPTKRQERAGGDLVGFAFEAADLKQERDALLDVLRQIADAYPELWDWSGVFAGYERHWIRRTADA